MQQAMQSTIGSLREMLFLLPHEAWASKRVSLLGARFASRVTAHPLTKFFLAPTLRRGEMWLFGLLMHVAPWNWRRNSVAQPYQNGTDQIAVFHGLFIFCAS
jgi:hypothetical protein